jgi:hypothetical protein
MINTEMNYIEVIPSSVNQKHQNSPELFTQ